MAREQHIGASEDWFIGEDKVLEFEIYGDDDVTLEDVATWAFRWVLRKQGESDAIVISKTTDDDITITGTFDPDPLVNTQKVEVAIEDTDTVNLQPGVYAHALKRTDDGQATINSYGKATLKKAAI